MPSEDLSHKRAAKEQFIDEKTLVSAFDTLKAGLSAQKRVRGKAKGTYEDVPDQSIRLKAAEALISFRLGRSNQSSTNYNLNLNGGSGHALPAEEVVQSMVAGGVDIVELLKLATEIDAKESTKQLEPIDI